MLLRLENIWKSFGGVHVLKGVGLQLDKGNVLGLVGENGAGKSTLMNILAGIFASSSGDMWIQGKHYAPENPNAAQREGLAFIHQELNLFPNLSIAENLFINNFPKKKIGVIPVLNKKVLYAKTRELLNQVGLSLSPNMLVSKLTPAQRQMVEIAKALSTRPQILILDEPTTSLTRHESQNLFNLIDRLKKEGMAMIYISHNLEDVLHLADWVAVLRNGQLVSEGEKTGYTVPTMVKEMIGREMEQYYPQRKNFTGQETLLKTHQLGAGVIQNISFEIKKREVLGFYGLVGAGRSEMARILFGLEPKQRGSITFNGKEIPFPKPTTWIKEGMAFLTEDRQDDGLMLQQSIGKNIQLASFPSHTGHWNIIDRNKIEALSLEQAQATKIKYNNLDKQWVATLSGGNQQKTVLAKWLLSRPQLFILDEPTKGIDIGAREDIYTLINGLVESGSGVLLISSDIDEVLGLSDRILVMCQGQIKKEFAKTEFDRAAILDAALHGRGKEETKK